MPYVLLRISAFIMDFIVLRVLYLVNDKIITIWKQNLAVSSVDLTQDLEMATQVLWTHFSMHVVVMLAYFTLTDGLLMKASLGKLAVRMQIVSANEKLSIKTALVRSFVKMFPFILLMALGELRLISHWYDAQANTDLITFAFCAVLMLLVVSLGLIVTDKKHQALHDKVAKTIVMRL